MKKKIAIVFISILLVGGIILYRFYAKIYDANVTETVYIFIPSNTNFDKVLELLSPYLKNNNSFNWVAEKKNYKNKIRSGKFQITKGMSNDQLVNYLRGGKAETINVTFNNQDTFEKLAGRISHQIETDSISLLSIFLESEFLNENGFNKNNAIAMYIPNSYEFYWNTSATKFRDRMLKEYKAYWNEERVGRAKKQNLTILQVSSLASIVQKETALVKERPTVAGLYLNRYHDNWPLQADPTIIFILKQIHGQDAVFKRVLNKDLRIDSPYNTYKNMGIPPGPIGMPDRSSLEAVLQPENHLYYYMCASVEEIGKHEFARTIRGHNINANKYYDWINQQGILR